MNNTSGGNMPFILFHSLNLKGNWTYLAEKNYDQQLRFQQYLGYHENILIALS